MRDKQIILLEKLASWHEHNALTIVCIIATIVIVTNLKPLELETAAVKYDTISDTITRKRTENSFSHV